MSEWSPLKVDILKVIENFMDMYPHSAPETLVIEAIANCLDAKATNIRISLYEEDGNKFFRVEDDGKGMTEQEFRDNYHALSVTSKTKGSGIGFAGVGSKLYLAFLASGENIITETRSESFRGASKITVIRNEPKWVYIKRETLEHAGTIYEVKLMSKDANFLNKKKITEIIQTHYNAILLGRYGKISISLDGKKVEPWKPEPASEASKVVDVFRIKKKLFKCYFWLTKEDLKQKHGIEIVVFGKKIKSNQWFDLDYIVKPSFRNKITGQILADDLATLLTTNKCDIRVQAGPALWTSFRKKAYDAFSKWLSKIGAIVERPLTELDPGFQKLSKELEKDINKLLKDPLFSDYNPFLRKHMKSVLVKTESGDVPAEEIEGSQKTKGTIGGNGSGQGVDVFGPNVGKSLHESDQGKETGTTLRRRVRHGIAISLEDSPNSQKESWLTPQAIVINIGHPVSLKCGVLGYPAWVQHVLKCVFCILLEQNPPQTFNETITKLREFYLKWSTI